MEGNKFLAEIYEQPDALRNTLNFYLQGDGKDLLSRAAQHWKNNQFERILFTGMGSSFFISAAASTILNNCGIPAQAVNAGELIHYHYPALTPRTMLVCISQSGESYEIKKILEKPGDHNSCIGICNEPDSTLAKNASLVLLSKAGKEYMTSTKTFTSTALVAILFSLALADQWTNTRVSGIRSVIKSVDDIIGNHTFWLSQAMVLLRNAGYIQLVGRGPSMAAVEQGALMFMEGAHIPASALFSGEFRHGPMELVKAGFLVIIFAPEGETYTQHVKLAEDIHRFGGKIIFLSNKKPAILPSEVIFIQIPCTDEYLFSIPAIIPLQFMVNQLAVDNGLIPGEFTKGAKVTDIE
jgi:glutamine---fructose-6-phosphate transaminase (isomerizing)